MLPFSGYGPIDSTERKALLCAALFSCLFIVVLGVARPRHRIQRTLTTDIGVPTPAPYRVHESEPTYVRSLERFRVRPEQFEQVDFTNYSYGLHTLSNGKKVDLNLRHGLLELQKDSGWFELKDVYYADMTGDSREEAIVWLTHETCNPSCDGGADLFYIYTESNGKLKRIWQYETGSRENECGLKSFILSEKQIVLELFGDCTQPAMNDSDHTKFVVQGSTSIRLEFDGWRFAQKSIDYFVTPPRNVRSYQPNIHIYSPAS